MTTHDNLLNKAQDAMKLQVIWHSYFPLAQTNFPFWRRLVDKYQSAAIEKSIMSTFRRQVKFRGQITPKQCVTYLLSLCYKNHQRTPKESPPVDV